MDIAALLSENLFVMHAFMANVTGSEVWRVGQEETDQVCGAIKNVARHYTDLPGVAQKTADWISLARTLGLVYGGRLMMLRAQRQAARRAAPPKPEGPPAPTELRRPTIVPSNPAPEQSARPGPQQGPLPGQTVRASPGPGLPEVDIPMPMPS